MDKLKVLVLGDGLLGTEIIKQTNWESVSRKKNLFDIDDLENSLAGYTPNVIINCIANTNTYSTDKQSHWNVNYVFVNNLIKYCNSNGIKLVHISTDYIYAGSINNASEEDVPVHCNNWYGYTKLLGDGLVQLQSNDYLLCRCTHKPSPFPYDGAWIDQIGNFDYVSVISGLIIEMVNNKLSGLYNVVTETKTMYELASQTKSVNKTFTPIHVPKNQSMNINKMTNDLNKNKPFFSIAIPTYEMNGYGTDFLEFSLQMLNKQTFKDFEVVVSDHSKNEDIKNLCDSWSETLNIKYFKNNYKVGGSSPNINNAMKNSNGTWIKILFQDDFLYDNESLAILKDHIDNHPNNEWFATGCEHSNDGVNMYRPFIPKWSKNIHLGMNTISSPSVITIKNTPNKLYFDEDLIWLMDVEYYKRMFLSYGEPSYLKMVNVVNRTWNESVSNTLTDERKKNEVNLMIAKYNYD